MDTNSVFIMSNKYFKHIILLPALVVFIGQSLLSQGNHFIGYSKALSGTNFTYHSPFSNREPCLLSRARASFEPIEWQTQVVPASYNKEKVSFIWLYGMDVLPEPQRYDFYVNNEKVLTFSSPTSNDYMKWHAEGKDGIRLDFSQSMIDKHEDQMGFAVLTLPTAMISIGEAVTLQVDGADNYSDAWYMTFKVPLEEKFSARQLKTVVKENGRLYHTVRLDFIHLGDPVQADIAIGDIEKSFTLSNGLNEIDVNLPRVEKPTSMILEVSIQNKAKQLRKISIKPIKEWTIYLVQHSHTDIGYTRPQHEILAEHLRYIDFALDYCDQTDAYPKDAQFRWTCEAAWTVREYFKNRPESQIERLLQRIKEGRIEVTGMFFNFSEIIDETALAIQTQTIKRFKDRGIDVTTAMQNDVNGIGWCMVDLYQNTGVKYLTMGQHGHRAHVPFDKPTSFWWESPAGNRLLAYRSEHYMHGNALSLTSGNMDVFRDNLSNYLEQLDQKNYPFDRTAFQFSGYITDNSPPSTIACEIVKEWNEKYEWPKLKMALASEFMVYMEDHHHEHIETKKVAWPDWWTDGFGSAMNETKMSRATHADMIANMGILSMARILGVQIPDQILDEIDLCYDNLMFYDEHTFGAAESIRDPSSENSVNQWRQKSSYVWTATQQSGLLREKAMGLIQSKIENSELPTITIFNTLNWNRDGLVHVFIDEEILPIDRAFEILDAYGEPVPAQIIQSRSEGSHWALWAKNIPYMGYATFSIKVKDQPLEIVTSESTKFSGILENEYYALRLDLQKGGITSLVDKEINKELIDEVSALKLGNFVYEQLDNRHTMERLTNDNRDTIYVPLKKALSYLSDIKVTSVQEGTIWKSVHLNGKLPECADDRGVNLEIRLYNFSKKVELLYDMRKLPTTDPEAVYVAFPFSMSEEDRLAFEAQGGTVYPGINQLEGTASDWNTIQNFAAVKNDDTQIILCSHDVPLVQFSEINTGRFYYTHKPQKPHIYSWVLNNYWTTNFRASQQGELKWSYEITSSRDNSNTFATQFGWENRIPMMARVLPGGDLSAVFEPKTILDLDTPSNLLLVNARPLHDDGGILLHLRETEGNHAILDVTKLLQQPTIYSVSEVNVLLEEIKPLDTPLLIEHFETKFILIKPNL